MLLKGKGSVTSTAAACRLLLDAILFARNQNIPIMQSAGTQGERSCDPDTARL